MFEKFLSFVRDIYGTKDFIPLHEPVFIGKEKKYLIETIDSTFVSSVGKFTDELEFRTTEYTGIKYAVITVNGTAALHIALKLSGVVPDTEVITQSLSFVATCNAITYCGASPLFLDVDRDTMGLSPENLQEFLESHCERRNDGFCWNKSTNKIVKACVPMHTYGFPLRIGKISRLCEKYNIALIEDSAESLGSFWSLNHHTGSLGQFAIFSFNGNKIVTAGGGGIIMTKDESLAKRAKHITTTAKVSHPWEFYHDEVGYNYRLPSLNAALGVAQMESLPFFVEKKRQLAQAYQEWGLQQGFRFVKEKENTRANYWLNVLLAENLKERDAVLDYTNNHAVMTRPAWVPMHKLPMFGYAYRDELTNTQWLADRIVNVPSGIPKSFLG